MPSHLLAKPRRTLNQRIDQSNCVSAMSQPISEITPSPIFLNRYLKRHSLERFSTYCYSDTRSPDFRSERLRHMASFWRDTAEMSDEDLAQLIRKDRIDILVDLTGHTESDRLMVFARKAAPVQITWNGYANTTGMSAIDYRLTDGYADPPGMTESLHTEKLLRMPEIYMPFETPEDCVDEGACPFTERGHVTFGSFNSISKITPRMVELWSRIMCGVPTSRLLLLTVPEGKSRSVCEALLRNAASVWVASKCVVA